MKVILRADPSDGNDPYEAEVELACLPRAGEKIESYWDDEQRWLDVVEVVHCPEEPGRVEVWVALEGYDAEGLRGVMEGLRELAKERVTR